MTDIRTIRTKEKLRNALIKLLSTIPYEKINVSEITEEANINRVTFYTHYQDKDDLLKDIVDNFSLSCANNAIDISKNKQNQKMSCKGIYNACVVSFVNYCIDNQDFLKCISRTKDGLILSYFGKSLSNAFVYATKSQNARKHDAYPFTIKFIISGYIEVIFSWLMEQNVPKEEFIKQIESFTQDLVDSKIIYSND